MFQVTLQLKTIFRDCICNPTLLIQKTGHRYKTKQKQQQQEPQKNKKTNTIEKLLESDSNLFSYKSHYIAMSDLHIHLHNMYISEFSFERASTFNKMTSSLTINNSVILY